MTVDFFCFSRAKIFFFFFLLKNPNQAASCIASRTHEGLGGPVLNPSIAARLHSPKYFRPWVHCGDLF